MTRNLSVDSQAGDSENAVFDLGITANGSCGTLPQGPVNVEQMKNTGSLELPLKDPSDIPASEKGW